jgi:hypothetical protein
MRFAGFLLCAISLCAQPATAPPYNLNARIALLQRLWNSAASPSGVTFEEARALRREHILWLIRNHPEHPAHATSEARIDPSAGPLADPQGYVEAVALWKEAAAKPGASAEAIANAAYFLGVCERLAAYSILNSVWPAQQGNPRVAKVRGILDARLKSRIGGEPLPREAFDEGGFDRGVRMLLVQRPVDLTAVPGSRIAIPAPEGGG